MKGTYDNKAVRFYIIKSENNVNIPFENVYALVADDVLGYPHGSTFNFILKGERTVCKIRGISYSKIKKLD